MLSILISLIIWGIISYAIISHKNHRDIKQPECEHEYKIVCKYYKESLSKYRNCSDDIKMYLVFMCAKCGEIKERNIQNKKFPPEWFQLEGKEEKDKFKAKLEKEGFLQEYEKNIMLYKR